jgi:hypothetical protein
MMMNAWKERWSWKHLFRHKSFGIFPGDSNIWPLNLGINLPPNRPGILTEPESWTFYRMMWVIFVGPAAKKNCSKLPTREFGIIM